MAGELDSVITEGGDTNADTLDVYELQQVSISYDRVIRDITVDVSVFWDDQDYEIAQRDFDRVGIDLDVIYDISLRLGVDTSLYYMERRFFEDDPREDERWGVETALRYRMLRNLSFRGALEYISQDSTLSAQEYEEFSARLSVLYQF